MSKRIAIATLLILAVIVVSFLALKSTEYTDQVTHEASKEGLLVDLESSGSLLSVKFPPSLSWERGETGSFALGLRNKYAEKREFSLNIKLEKFNSLPPPEIMKNAAESWITLPFILELGPEESMAADIILRPQNPQAGSYLYRLEICETECDSSKSAYATATFSFSVKPA